MQRRALQESVFIVTGEPFYADGGGTRELRICFTSRPPDVGIVAARAIAAGIVTAGQQARQDEPISRIV